jgi:hypothetical protein
VSDTSNPGDDEPEPVDPVEAMNQAEERQVVELVNLDQDLDEQQEKLDRLMHDDTVGVIWFGDDDAWLDKRLNNDG